MPNLKTLRALPCRPSFPLLRLTQPWGVYGGRSTKRGFVWGPDDGESQRFLQEVMPLARSIPWEDFHRYFALIIVDGNSWPDRYYLFPPPLTFLTFSPLVTCIILCHDGLCYASR